MALDTLDKVRAAPRRRIDWSANTTATGTGFLFTPNGTVWGGTGLIPFTSAPTSAGYNPTSLTYNGETINALDAPAVIVDMSSTLRNGMFFIFDLLWHWQTTTVTASTPVTITGQPTLPARDVDGASAGRGCFGVAWSSLQNNTISIGYTNSAGTGSRSGTVTVPFSSNCGPHIFSLAGGDLGVRSIDSVTASVSSDVNVSIVRLLAMGVDSSSPIVTGQDATPTGRPIAYLSPVPAGAMLFPVLGASNVSNQGMNPSVTLAMDY